jgi:hypothetical protein
MPKLKHAVIMVVSFLGVCFFLVSVLVFLHEVQHHGVKDVTEHLIHGTHTEEFHQ